MLEPQHVQPCDSPNSAHDDSLRAAARRLGQGRCIMRRAKATGQHSKAREPCGTRIIAPIGAAPAPRLFACRCSRDTTHHGRHRYCQEGCGLLRTLQESASETGSHLGPAGSLTALDNASGPPRRGSQAQGFDADPAPRIPPNARVAAIRASPAGLSAESGASADVAAKMTVRDSSTPASCRCSAAPPAMLPAARPTPWQRLLFRKCMNPAEEGNLAGLEVAIPRSVRRLLGWCLC
jgi:hypothetical protein